MTEPFFTIDSEDALIDKRLSQDEVKEALKELERLLNFTELYVTREDFRLRS
ncbi:MAG: hypothetical protein Q9P01_08005 [Anaerolineae bacterium]|nr:hypothetical protein [Anaerolineae bacterium]